MGSAFDKQHTPTIEQFLTLPAHLQFDWISKNIDDYEMRLYGDGYLGISYPVDKDILDQYRENPLDYGVSDLISTQIQDISETRLEEIDQGANLTKDEVRFSLVGMWHDTSHRGFNVPVPDFMSRTISAKEYFNQIMD